jgi:N-acyl-D-aspartate/D-glutamate deacylase
VNVSIVIRGGLVFDGSGGTPFPATLGIDGGRIRAIVRDGASADLHGTEVIDATGLAVAPGFIDIHSHSDWILPQESHERVLAPLIEQGTTTLVTGNCGFSPAPVNPRFRSLLEVSSELVRDGPLSFEWETHREFLDHLASRPPALNVAHLAGHGSIRLAVMGDRFLPASAADMTAMQRWVREAMEAGCFGLSTGLGYAPGMFAEPEELTTVARTVAECGGLFTSHLRAYTWISPFFRLSPLRWQSHNVRAIDEILDVSRAAAARLQISHLIYVGRGTWKTHRRAIAAIERARETGLDVGFDTFPYTAGNTTIRVIYPGWAQRDLPHNLERTGVRLRLKTEWHVLRRLLQLDVSEVQLLWGSNPALAAFEGMRFDEIGRALGMDPMDAYLHVTRESNANARVMIFQYSGDADNEDALLHTMAHPLNSIETDTILTTRGHHNPASFGTFPRFLGEYSRDRGLVSLHTAVHKMTGLPAARLGLGDRGSIREGNYADLTLFDPATIAGPADFETPDRRPRGIHYVLINGVPVVRSGTYAGARHGVLLRKPAA